MEVWRVRRQLLECDLMKQMAVIVCSNTMKDFREKQAHSVEKVVMAVWKMRRMFGSLF